MVETVHAFHGRFLATCGVHFSMGDVLLSVVHRVVRTLCALSLPIVDIECMRGFYQNGNKCEDIDECVSHPCVPGANMHQHSAQFQLSMQNFLDVNS